jgi:peptidyl-dipeptidase Dcp
MRATAKPANPFQQHCWTSSSGRTSLIRPGPPSSTPALRQVVALGLPPDIGQRHYLAHFQHLFAGSSYAAGYYVYLWAEVLEADGFAAFTETGDPFDPATAERLLRTIYSAGNQQNPADAYRAFRGRDPQVTPMLHKRGLITTTMA